MSLVGLHLGSYELVRELGSGGMGSVWLARSADGDAAIKILHPHLLASPGCFKRFLREAEIGRTIDHPNVVRTLGADVLVAAGRTFHFLVMEYVEGQTLRDLAADLGRVPEELCRHIGREVAAGLAAIHDRGAVHRDLKPANVLITAAHAVKLMDLGVARIADEAIRLSQTGAFVGSIHYAAPEQFRSRERRVDHRADLYALGLLLYELATGEHPFPGEDVHSVIRAVLQEEPRAASRLNPQLTPFFEEVVATLLAKEPEERFPDAAAVAAVLAEGEESAWWAERSRAVRARSRGALRCARVPRDTSLYGREEDLARLVSSFDAAAAGAGRVVLIEGEAGVGKSRLVDELAIRLEAEGREFRFLSGCYAPGGAATAAGAWSSAFREPFGDADLESSLRRHLPETPALASAFAALLRSAAGTDGGVSLSRESVQTCFVRLARSLAAERPVVLVIDDLHFAPEEGRALFAALALAVPGHRILLVGTHRPGLPEPWLVSVERMEHVGRTTLRRLGAKDLVRLLREFFRSPRLAEDLAAKVALKSDGNPFFVFEIIRVLREGGYVEPGEDGVWVARREVREIDIPSSVLDLVGARVAELDEEEREILEVAACAGFEFEPKLVGAVAGKPPVPALRLLARIERDHRLVRAVGPRYVFDHHQVHEALYRGLSESLRVEYHGAVATALEARLAGAADGGAAVEICEQYARGGRGGIALRYARTALDHLEAACRNERALGLLDRLFAAGPVEGAEGIDLRLRAADLNERVGRPEEARRLLAAAAERADGAEDRARAARVRARLGRVLLFLGDLHGARAALEAAAADAAAADEPLVTATVLQETGNFLDRTGDPVGAEEKYRHALRRAEEAGDRSLAARLGGNLGLVAWRQGRLGEARERLESVLPFFRESRDHLSEAKAVSALGIVLDAMGRPDDAAAMHRRHLDLCREIGFRRGVVVASVNLGRLLRERGRPAAALPRLVESGRVAEEIGDALGVATAAVNLGIAWKDLGELRAARGELVRGVRRARSLRAPLEEGLGALYLAEVREEAGRAASAMRLARRAERILEAGGLLSEAASAAILRGRLLLEKGDAAEGRRLVEGAVATAKETGARETAAMGTVVLARHGGGPVDRAEAAYRAAASEMVPTARLFALRLLHEASGEERYRREWEEEAAALLESTPGDYRKTMTRWLGATGQGG